MAKALIIVDLQQDFCPGGALAVPQGDAIVPLINKLLPWFHRVLATRDWHPPGHISFASRHGRQPLEVVDTEYGAQVLWPDHCLQNSVGAEFHPALDTGAIQHITYKGLDPEVDSYSGFFDNARQHQTDLHAELQQHDIDQVYLVGLATDYCVKATALDALDLGYATFVIADACRGVEAAAGDVERALDEIRRHGGQIITSEQVFHPADGGPA